jgi:endonuclease-3
MMTFSLLIASLRKQYPTIEPPPAHAPFALVMWENACYLLPDERRLEVFEALRKEVGLDATSLLNAPDERLLPIAKRGGMRPETRVFRWREIASITLSQFGGDLDSILDKPYPEAKRALKLFPAIGDPGAEKILLFCGIAPPSGLPLESNGLRTLTRLAWGREQKSYGATYRSVQTALAPELPTDAGRLARAHLLLREHGKVLCKADRPLCHQCPVAKRCEYAATQAAAFS